MADASIPVLDLSLAADPLTKADLLCRLREAMFDVGFLYVVNHGVSPSVIDSLTGLLPALFALSDDKKQALSKLNSPHFLGYNGFAEETTLGQSDLREQFDFATELPVIWQAGARTVSVQNGLSGNGSRGSEEDLSQLYWRLRGPNQWPEEDWVPGFRSALTKYHDEVQQLSYRFVHLIEEALGIPVHTYDHFFSIADTTDQFGSKSKWTTVHPPQHRIKLLRYPPVTSSDAGSQGVGAHKDSSGWLTFLYQVGDEPGLEVLSSTGSWLPVQPIEGSFVVNFGNAFEAATQGAVKATIHRVVAPGPQANVRYSIPFFQGLPLDMSVSEIQTYIPEDVRQMSEKRLKRKYDNISSFLDPRWDSLGHSQLRKWIRSHKDVGLKHYGPDVVEYYTQEDVPVASANRDSMSTQAT